MVSVLAAALALAQPARLPGATVAADSGERIVTATGYYAGVDEDEEGVRLRLDDAPLRFRLPRLSAAESEPYVRLVTTAAQRGFALHVRFDGTAGRVDAQNGTVTYPLCSLSVGDVQPIGDETANCPAAQASDQQGSGASLARALAERRAHPEAAVQLLGGVLADRDLAPPLRATALGARAEAEAILAEGREWGGEDFDRLMIAALADFRARVAIEPDDADAQYAVGETLTALGAYDEALAIYANIGRRWPDEALRVATRTGAIFRQRGDYRRALAALDDYAARAGRPDGMRFAYHRAWTLVMLGRFRDALAEIDIGLRSQPDYSSAWALRSCADAQLGAVDEARQDQERSLQLLQLLEDAGRPPIDAEIARTRRLVGMLAATRGAVSAAILNEVCRAPWEHYDRTRPRSRLLGAQPHAA